MAKWKSLGYTRGGKPYDNKGNEEELFPLRDDDTYLRSSPLNADRLTAAIDQLNRGEGKLLCKCMNTDCSNPHASDDDEETR